MSKAKREAYMGLIAVVAYMIACHLELQDHNRTTDYLTHVEQKAQEIRDGSHH